MDRNLLLKRLINCDNLLNETIIELGMFGWDSDTELVTLTIVDILNVLSKYLNKEISNQTVERWANAIESREDIAYDRLYKKMINDIIYELSNPELTGKLNREKACNMFNQLKGISRVHLE